MNQVIITDRAIIDIKKAKDWYEEKQEGLGHQFADHVFKCIEEIKRHPLAYPGKYKHTREMYIRKYPYLIIYKIEEKIIFVLRVFPCKTNPKKKYRNK